MTVLLHVERAEGMESPDDDSFSCWVKAALAADPARQPPGDPEISVRVADSAEIARLNAEYRGKSGPTNVLSFPVELPEGVEADLLGDIVICAPLVAQEAQSQGKAADAHWAHLTIHGVLHLLGHDHIQNDEAEVMEALEIQTLAKLGYPNPYHTIPDEDPVHQTTEPTRAGGANAS